MTNKSRMARHFLRQFYFRKPLKRCYRPYRRMHFWYRTYKRLVKHEITDRLFSRIIYENDVAMDNKL